MNKRFYVSLIGIFFSIIFFSCAQTTVQKQASVMGTNKPYMFICNDSSAYIGWAPSDDPNVIGYELHYRTNGENGWNYLSTVSASDTPLANIRYSQLGNGVFDFAVNTVLQNGAKSDLHISTDTTAILKSGWFLRWDLE